jgi:ABC-type transporter Mla subunit MlaD
MPHHPVRNRALAGGFLLAAMAAALAVLVLLGGWDAWFQDVQILRVRFRAAPNLKVGSPVLLAGHPVGRVEKILLVPVTLPAPKNDEAAAPAGKPAVPEAPITVYRVEVMASLPRTYVIHKDARVVIVQALVGQSAAVNIENVGRGEPAGEFLEGQEASVFAEAASELGIGEGERQDIGDIIHDFKVVAATLRADLPGIVDKLKTTSADLAEGSKKASDALTKVHLVLDENRENVKAAIASAKSATEKVDQGTGEVVKNITAASGDVKAASGDVRAIVAENRDDIRQTVQHLHGTAQKADKDIGAIVANAHAASADLKVAVADFRTIAGDTKALVATNRANLATTLQNFRETSDHLLALAKEVRRAPWRLFATPDKQEVESLNLYDSARAFAQAATDLQGVADTLQVMLEARDRGVEVNPEVLKEMLKRLEETFAKYQEAEKTILKEFQRVQK